MLELDSGRRPTDEFLDGLGKRDEPTRKLMVQWLQKIAEAEGGYDLLCHNSVYANPGTRAKSPCRLREFKRPSNIRLIWMDYPPRRVLLITGFKKPSSKRAQTKLVRGAYALAEAFVECD